MICNSLQRPKYFQCDGAPPHRTGTALQILRKEFDGRLIGIGGAIQWSPRSPDLSPLDFSMWGTVKNAVYRYKNEDTIENFKHTISQKCQDIASLHRPRWTSIRAEPGLRSSNLTENKYLSLFGRKQTALFRVTKNYYVRKFTVIHHSTAIFFSRIWYILA